MNCSEELCEILGTNKDFGMTESHPVLVQSLSESLNVAFAGDDSALVLMISLDKTREKSLKAAVNAFDSELGSVQIQVTTPQILEQLMTIDAKQFSSMLKDCRRCIVWLHPRDFTDNTLAYWFRVYQKMPIRVPVAYFSAFEPDESIFTAYHPQIQWLHSLVQHDDGLPNIYFLSDDGEPLYSKEFAERCSGKKTIVSCRDEFHKVRYSEASHRAHVLVTGKKAGKKNAFQVISSDVLSDYSLPAIPWDQFVSIDPLPGENVLDISRNFGTQPVNTSIVATSCFSLLNALSQTCPCHESDETIVEIYDLFQRLHQGPVQVPKSGILATCIEYWCECGYLLVLGNRAELTDLGRKLFPGIVEFSQFGNLHSYCHDSPCQTKNHEYLGLIESKFLRQYGNLSFCAASQMFQLQFHNALGCEATLKPCQTSSSWLDRLPVHFTRPQMARIESVIFDKNEDFQCIPDHQTLTKIREIRDHFASMPGHPCIEVTPGCAQWWTFAGAENNALLTKILLEVAPKLHVSFGNFHIRLNWPEMPASALTRIIERLKNIYLEIVKRIKQPQTLPGAVQKSWQKSHIYSWMFEIIPPDYQKYLFEKAIKDLDEWIENDIPIVETAILHEIDPLPENEARPVELPPVQESKMPASPKICTDFNTPISSITKPYPVIEGIMHTRYPWYYIDDDILFGRAMNIILQQEFIGLDVETTLYDHRLCLIQIGCSDRSFLIDPFKVDFSGLAQVFSHPDIPIVIHNSTFECSVMSGYQIQIQNIVDTMKVSRKIYGKDCPNGHSLKAVCKREFGLEMSKECQISRWETRPLTPQQLEYAALDAEILVHLYRKFFNKK